MEVNPFDPLFRVPFVVGFIASVLLALLGALLRLRGEWLAALGFAHLAAAGGLAGLVISLPLTAGAVTAAVIGAGIKTFAGARGNNAYAVMILLGWSVTLLLAANTHHGEALAHALADGQLYFASTEHLVAIGTLAVMTAVLFPWFMPRLVRARLFPLHELANRLPAWRWHLGFDVMVAATLAAATATIGLMAAFALVFVPSWIVFRMARAWRHTLWWAAGLGGGSYLLAFVVALWLDQPFGPVMVAVVLLTLPVALLSRPETGKGL